MKVPKSTIQVIEEVFQSELCPDLVDIVQRAPDRQFAKLTEAVEEFCYSDPAVGIPREQGELRPYFSSHYRRNRYADWVVRGIGIDRRTFDDVEHVWTAIDSLKLRLLYCHSIAIDDPGSFIMDLFRPYFRCIDRFWREFDNVKQRFINYLSFLIQVKPLIDAGVLILVPQNVTDNQREEGGYKAGYARERLERLREKLDFSDFAREWTKQLDPIEEVTNDFDDMFAEGFIEVAEDSFSATATVSQHVTGGVDFYFPFQYWHQVYRDMVTQIDLDLRRLSVSEHQNALLQQLICLPVPGLPELDPKRIVEIRQKEDAFEDWRQTLGRSLERLATVPKDGLTYEQDCLRVIRNETHESLKRLKQGIAGSSFLSKLGQGGKTLVIGSLSALAAQPFVGGLEAGLVTAGTTALAELIVQKLKTNSDTKALISHYVAFYPKP